MIFTHDFVTRVGWVGLWGFLWWAPWWSFLLADGAHHKKPHSPTHPTRVTKSWVKIIGKSHHEWPKINIHSNKCIISFLNAILCLEQTIPIKTIIDRSFRHWRQGRFFSDLTLWRHHSWYMTSPEWHCDVIFIDCSCTSKLVQRHSSLENNNREHWFHGLACKKMASYTLSREYRFVRYRYSRLLFTSEDRLCANLCKQEQSTNTTSECQCPTFAWRHRSTVLIRKECP